MAKEGFVIIFVTWLITFLFWILGLKLNSKITIGIAIFFTLVSFFVMWFFRDPNREITTNPNAIVSPADGKIIDIKEMVEDEFIKEKTIKVSIFLNVFNVHVNRMPVAGTVRFSKYYPGKFLAAFVEKASKENEQTCVGVECDNGQKIVVKQIAGLIARRIICYADSGKVYKKGDRFGIIRFGSRTDLFLPIGTTLNIKLGDKVSGGSSIIGEFKK